MQNTTPTDRPQRIDLTQQTDAQYWCRIFDVTMEELREAVQHAGHEADAVQRWLREHQGKAGA